MARDRFANAGSRCGALTVRMEAVLLRSPFMGVGLTGTTFARGFTGKAEAEGSEFGIVDGVKSRLRVGGRDGWRKIIAEYYVCTRTGFCSLMVDRF